MRQAVGNHFARFVECQGLTVFDSLYFSFARQVEFQIRLPDGRDAGLTVLLFKYRNCFEGVTL